jgi:phosphate transport system substrate-binding protein
MEILSRYKKRLFKREIMLRLVTYIFLLIAIVSCTGSHKRTDTDTANSGVIHISVDESFKPVIDSQIQVFEALYPKAKIIAEYKPEAECLRDLMKDSTRMIIVTKGLTDEEAKIYKDTLSYSPQWDKVANDAVAIVVNNNSPDTILTLAKIRGILSGTTGDKEIAVFDGVRATSSVRYAIDSILKGKPFDPKKVFAVRNSQEVIDYISKNNNAIGFVGVFLKKVKIAAIECEKCEGKPYVKPYQANIMTKRYPLVRGLYYILKENYDGLGSGFANFLIYEKGQLIFRRAYLGPAKMNFSIRSATTH